ncbi:hypothetical protein PSZ75_23455, partial [Shigella sonnei]|nr:hypothetical protein [Shigella sonnei]
SLLDYHSIWEEVANPDLLALIKNLGYGEALPVVKNPKIINPKDFIDQLLTKRLPNKNLPDTPQEFFVTYLPQFSVVYLEYFYLVNV